MKAKKHLGQHFLTQPAVAERIANAIKMDRPDTPVLEVGPGKGMLTQFLRNRTSNLTMVETDPDMIQILESRFPEQKTSVIHANFLKFDLSKVMLDSFVLTGNFPYNISSQIIIRLLNHREQIPQMVGMFQKEVAARLVSGHGSKTYGILSVLLQVYYDVEYLFTVKPKNFDPPPKVDSAVIRAIRKPEVEHSPAFDKKLRQLVKLAFNQRRKMLRNSLKSALPEKFSRDHHFMTLRPEQLTVDDFLTLTSIVISLQDNASE